MLTSKAQIKAYRGMFRAPCVSSAGKEILSEKYLADVTDTEQQSNSFQIDLENCPPNFEQGIRNILAAQRNTQVRKCREKYKLTLFDLPWLLYGLLKSRNMDDASAVFYFRSEAKEMTRIVDGYTSVFRRYGHTIWVEHSEKRFYRFLKCHSPAIVHCLSGILECPISTDGVKVASFDFDDSHDVAIGARLFCPCSLGYKSNTHYGESSTRFFREFYERILRGEPVFHSYDVVCGQLACAPYLARGAMIKVKDFVVFPLKRVDNIGCLKHKK